MNTSRLLRRIGWSALAVAGTVAFAAALFPSVATSLPIDTAIRRLGNDYFLLAVFGVAGLAVLLWMGVRRARERVVQASPPEPETAADAPRPGDPFDECLAQWPGRISAADREQLIERLRTAAIRAEMQAGASRETARERVTTGAWTEDPVAARFLQPDTSGPPVGRRVRLALTGDSWAQAGARATAAALTSGSADR